MLRVKNTVKIKNVMPEEKINNLRQLYIGIGSNLDSPVAQVSLAIKKLSELDEHHTMKVSNFYESPPMGPSDQNNYINAVVMFKCGESPEDILLLIKGIESSMGRKKEAIRWSERIIDLDIIMYGDIPYKSDVLSIPHINACERAFVLLPIMDISPDIYIPTQGYAKDLIRECLYSDIKKINKK